VDDEAASDPAAGPAPTSPVRPEDLRAGDADRELVLERLRAARVEGRLDLEEFDERVTAALAARTYGELGAITADLPGGSPDPRPLGTPRPRPRVSAPPRQEMDLRGGVAAWVVVNLLMMAIWTVVGVTTGVFGHPWWIWVAAPSGMILLASWLGARARRG
jgi:uncharacterized protein DUF1707